MGITWTLPIFAFFYLLAPWIMRAVKGWKSAVSMFGVIFLLSLILKQFYNCSIFRNIPYFLLGIMIYFCWQENKLMPCAIVFLGMAIVVTILGEKAYIPIIVASICIGLEKEISLSSVVQKLVDKIDDYSYSLYLVHGVVFCSLIDRLKTGRLFNISNAMIGVIALVGTFAGTIVIHHFVELPVQKYLARLLVNNRTKLEGN